MSSPSQKAESPNSQLRVAVLIACHNRKNITIQCLKSLYAARPSNWVLKIYLVDDGSTDGTSEAVEQFDPAIQIIKGDGSWYWAHSMYQAEMAINEPSDAILWLNDDVQLDINSLSQIHNQYVVNSQSILVGQFRSSTAENLTYGGYVKYDKHPFHFNLVYAQDELKLADTFNGNLIFIPIAISNTIGPIDGEFAHAYADIDFGLRARAHGVKVGVIPGFIGICEISYGPDFMSLRDKFYSLFSTKNSPIKSQIRFLRRHGNFLWPVYLFAPILKVLLSSLFRKTKL